MHHHLSRELQRQLDDRGLRAESLPSTGRMLRERRLLYFHVAVSVFGDMGARLALCAEPVSRDGRVLHQRRLLYFCAAAFVRGNMDAQFALRPVPLHWTRRLLR